uniref:Bm11062 n=1 Tax=Brugia malayi TaxID=6279 RepID=A0A0H5SC16_BRUMA|nr:Bm11062 [Brugia malayi]
MLIFVKINSKSKRTFNCITMPFNSCWSALLSGCLLAPIRIGSGTTEDRNERATGQTLGQSCSAVVVVYWSRCNVTLRGDGGVGGEVRSAISIDLLLS